ncbi:MAG: glycosyltransferase family 4 protein [Verrucomicrobia bacterium]|nr:glycosyltransferase family 4 protein [Verrucomicrobiota bacterium]
MKILHLVYECLPGAYRGGVQKMVAELALAQGCRGDEVEIWAIGDGPVTQLGPRTLLRYFPGRIRWGSSALRQALLAGHARFDLIHSHNTFLPLNVAAAQAARRGAAVYYHAHGALDPQLLRGWGPKEVKKRLYVSGMERRNYDVAQGIFGLTEAECAQLQLVGAKAPIFEVGNGIVLQPPAESLAVANFRLVHRVPYGGQVILFIGRITHKKGLHHLIDALPRIRERFPEALFVIGGDREQDVEYVRALDQQISALGLIDAIRWVGFLDEVGKRAAFASCRLFAHPSYSEGMALAILEAMAAGLPTVVTPGCYMSAAVRAGVLTESAQDAGRLAEAITALFANQEAAARLGAAGREYVQKYHTWDAVAGRLDRIYRKEPEVAPFIATPVS